MSAEPKPLVLPDILRDRANAVRAAFGRGFVALSQAGGFDPARDWCGANLRGVDLRGEDVSGFRFFGANLNGAKVAGARNAELRMFRGAVFDQDTHWPADWLAAIRAGALDVDSRIRRGDPDTGLWADQNVPAWAEEWGRDQYGAHATVVFNEVSQRLRWCPPGSFLMRTEKEAGRTGTEGPQHRVTFTAGFWMFETACTAELWAAVMKRPVSRGLGGFPVTQVSWRDAQAFVAAFNAAKPALGLSLPSEAQWEYSCRAGTDFPFSFGKGVTKEQVNFEGDGPVLVRSLPPNAWGLHEMHGNVWEWCADTWHAGYDGAPPDGSAWIDEATGSRVVRGGAFNGPARYVRSASRYRRAPGDRFDYLGFRCARVQAGEAEPSSGPAEPARAEPVARPRVFKPVVPRPAWASDFGADRHGTYAAITVPNTDVTQRLRWVPPGSFTMGSPEDEAGRFPDEGPRHEVVFAEGYWLFETPCTQALWTAVMGTNPSRFVDPLRPVESVDYKQVLSFIARLNRRIPGLDLCLPSEAEFERAARGGKNTATWAGDLDIVGEYNAPVLDAIAWYGGNSGVGFDLADGWDSSGWRDKQYPHRVTGTRRVAEKLVNPFGFYDLLGNVWEWCADTWHDSYDGAPVDGTAWIDKGAASRVVRGGAFLSPARLVRSASRHGNDPDDRYDHLGFRCARVQVSGEAERRAGRGKRRERSDQVASASPERSGGGSSSRRPKGGKL